MPRVSEVRALGAIGSVVIGGSAQPLLQSLTENGPCAEGRLSGGIVITGNDGTAYSLPRAD
jgi:hypothetical protein